MAQGVWFEAAALLEQHLRARPDDLDARLERAQALFRLGRYREAVDEALQVAAQRPGHEELTRLFTRIRLHLSRETNREDPESLVEYARLCVRMRSYDRARNAYRAALELRDDIGWRRELARVLWWSGRLDEAAGQYRSILSHGDTSPEIRLELARVYQALGQLELAERELRAVMAQVPDSVVARVELARTLNWMGRPEEADPLLEDAIARDPRSVDARLLRAEWLLRQNRVEEAHALLQAVLRIDPTHERAGELMRDLEESRRLEIARLRRLLLETPDANDLRARYFELLLQFGWPAEIFREWRERAGPLLGDPIWVERIEALRHATRVNVERRIREYASRRHPISGVSRDVLEAWLRAHPEDERARALVGIEASIDRDLSPRPPDARSTP